MHGKVRLDVPVAWPRSRVAQRLHPFGCLVLLALVWAGSGCTHSYRTDWVAPGFRTALLHRIALVPLENRSGYPQAGEIVARLLATELYHEGVSLVKESVVRAALKEAKLDPELEPEGAARTDWAEFGRKLGADGVLIGAVEEMRYKRDLGEDPVVGFSVRLIDVATGRVLWAASHSRAEHGIFYHKHHLHENVQRIAHAMVSYLLDEAGAPAEGSSEEPSQEATP